MAEALKNHFGADVPAAIAVMVCAVHADFPAAAFVSDALSGYDALELMPRGRHIARALHRHLPAHYPTALEILITSAQRDNQRAVPSGMGGFLFMPHCFFVAEYGLDDFEPSMRALYVLTQHFTAEFAIRPFLVQHARATLERLAEWAHDPNDPVRRLVSEGTRPRLPWAPRLPAFQADPSPVLALLELLRDDPSLYVRRSVANNLNDIGKDHPKLLAEVARRWMVDAPAPRQWVVRHALRWAVKNGDPAALQVLGFGKPARVEVSEVAITPARVSIGASLCVRFALRNRLSRPQDLLVDLQVHYLKANGSPSAKVFKLKTLRLEPRETVHLQKKLSLAEMTTRKHYPGAHAVDVLVNGKPLPLGSFDLLG